jgi:PHD/YefM family antitoxin component YafN of YafNO toxin-antitoxin module
MVVTNNGQPVAVVISIEDFKLLEALTQEKGESSKAAIADFFRVHTSPRSGA